MPSYQVKTGCQVTLSINTGGPEARAGLSMLLRRQAMSSVNPRVLLTQGGGPRVTGSALRLVLGYRQAERELREEIRDEGGPGRPNAWPGH